MKKSDGSAGIGPIRRFLFRGIKLFLGMKHLLVGLAIFLLLCKHLHQLGHVLLSEGALLTECLHAQGERAGEIGHVARYAHVELESHLISLFLRCCGVDDILQLDGKIVERSVAELDHAHIVILSECGLLEPHLPQLCSLLIAVKRILGIYRCDGGSLWLGRGSLSTFRLGGSGKWVSVIS